jgi:hypothetical protein
MADSKGYEVLVDELTVHKAVRELNHPITGEKIGWQQGQGETWFLGEVIPPEAINPEWAEALESGEGSLYESLKEKLKPSSDEPAVSDAVRMGMPFEGYDDMEEDDILAAMRVLPSATATRIKEWEARQDEPRDAIVHFNIGYGVSPGDYQEGKVPGGDASTEGDESKPVRAIRTRQVAAVDEDGPTVPGEGVTGTGDPQVEPGTAAAAEAADEAPKTARRAGRRPRPQRTQQATTESTEGS